MKGPITFCFSNSLENFIGEFNINDEQNKEKIQFALRGLLAGTLKLSVAVIVDNETRDLVLTDIVVVSKFPPVEPKDIQIKKSPLCKGCGNESKTKYCRTGITQYNNKKRCGFKI